MKALILAVASSLLLAACNGEPAPAANAAPAPAVVCPEVSGSVVPGSTVQFGFPHHVASDRYYSSESGEPRRRIVVEYLTDSAGGTWNAVVESMTEAGYRLLTETAGVNKGSFAKAGSPTLHVNVGDKAPAPADAAHPDAKGTIWISWPSGLKAKEQKKTPADPAGVAVAG